MQPPKEVEPPIPQSVRHNKRKKRPGKRPPPKRFQRRKSSMSSLQDRAARLAELAAQEFPESWIPSAEGDLIVGEFVRLDQGPTTRGPASIVVLRTENGD